MINTCYDPTVDEEIFKILDSKKETTFTELFNTLNKNKSINSHTTISQHLKYLTNNKKILLWERNPEVRKGSIKFTHEAEKKRRWDLLTIDYSNKKVCKEWRENMKIKEINERRKQAILFLLLAVANGYTGYKVSLKPQLGDVLLRDSSGNPLTISDEYTDEGFLPTDLDREDFQLSVIYNFLHFNKFTKEETEDIIKEFEKNGDVKFRKIRRRNKEIGYDVEDEVLKDLLIQCCYILSIVFDRIREYWYILSKIKLTQDEFYWFRFIVGDRIATKFFQKIEENRAKGKTIKDLYMEFHERNTNKETAKKIVENKEKHSPKYFTKSKFEKTLFSHSIVEILEIPCKNITSNKKIQQIINEKKYSFIVNELFDIVYPPFSRELFKVKLN